MPMMPGKMISPLQKNGFKTISQNGSQFKLNIHKANEGCFGVTFPDLPECMTQGDDM